MERTLLVVTGLSREARAASGAGVTTVCSGGDPARLAVLLAEIDARRHYGVVSFGIAGGLHPDLEPGNIVLGEAVVHSEATYETCDILGASLRRAFLGRAIRVVEGAVAGVDEVILTPGHKASLRQSSGAVAVDMESHVAARWAVESELPFSVVRVVSDPAHRALPALAAEAVRPDGGVDTLRVMRGLAKSPRQIGALASAGLDARAAFAALAAAGRCLQRRPVAADVATAEAFAPV